MSAHRTAQRRFIVQPSADLVINCLRSRINGIRFLRPFARMLAHGQKLTDDFQVLKAQVSDISRCYITADALSVLMFGSLGAGAQ